MRIDETNIEEILFDYAEGNLTDEERLRTETYLRLHPEYKRMLDMYDPNATIEKPTDIVYDGKEDLFALSASGKSPKVVLISKYIKWISACAAAIALFVVIKGYGDFVNGPNTELISKNDGLKGDNIKIESHNVVAARPTDIEKSDFSDSKTAKSNNETAKDTKDTSIAERNMIVLDERLAQTDNETLHDENNVTTGDVNPIENDDATVDLSEKNHDLIAQNVDLTETEEPVVEKYERHTTVYQKKSDIKGDWAVKYLPMDNLKGALVSTMGAVASALNTPKARRLINVLTGRKNRQTKVIYRQYEIKQENNV